MTKTAKDPFSFEERKKIKQLMDMGATFEEIATSLDRSYSSIQWEIRQGGDKKKYNPLRSVSVKEKPMRQQNQPRAFSSSEIANLKIWIKEGRGINYMRAQLKCGHIRITRFLDEEDLDVKNFSFTMICKRLDKMQEEINMLKEKQK